MRKIQKQNRTCARNIRFANDKRNILIQTQNGTERS